MEIPFKGNVNPRLLKKLYKNKVFYDVRQNNKGRYVSSPCILSNCDWSIDFPFVKFLDKQTPLDEITSSSCESWNNIFENYKDGKAEAKRRNHLYFNCFRYKPFLKLDILEKYIKQLMYIESEINKCLIGFENFNGIDFCDVHASGIQIRGHHKQIKGYTFGDQPTIKYDFSNIEEVILEFIDMWRKNDRPDSVRKYQEFLSWGEKYGWD